MVDNKMYCVVCIVWHSKYEPREDQTQLIFGSTVREHQGMLLDHVHDLYVALSHMGMKRISK